MITRSSILTDNFVDDVLPLLKLLNERRLWNSDAKLYKEQLNTLLLSKGYIEFTTEYSGYIVQSIGSSYLYDVPMYKRGYLLEFRGKRVRVVCVGSGEFKYRTYMAGVVGETPHEKLVIKLEHEYSFPDTGTHTVIYRSPRFKIIRTDGNSKIFTSYSANGQIDLDLCDAIVIDGKKGIPIATLIYKAGGLMHGKVLGFPIGESRPNDVYTSLKGALRRLKTISDDYHMASAWQTHR
jgi:hypothetical protein